MLGFLHWASVADTDEPIYTAPAQGNEQLLGTFYLCGVESIKTIMTPKTEVDTTMINNWYLIYFKYSLLHFTEKYPEINFINYLSINYIKWVKTVMQLRLVTFQIKREVHQKKLFAFLPRWKSWYHSDLSVKYKAVCFQSQRLALNVELALP